MERGENEVVDALGGLGMHRCPAHDDTRASLSVSESEGKVLAYCFAGCSIEDVCAAAGIKVSDLFQDDRGTIANFYVYTDEDGQPLYRVVRLQPKAFSQDRYDNGQWLPGLKDTRRVLYHLPRVLANSDIWLVEGEKDADYLAPAYVACATTMSGGASSRDFDCLGVLAGKNVTIVGDNDKPGRERAALLAHQLRARANTVRVLYPAGNCKDATEHLLAGYGIEDFIEHGPDDSVFEPFDWRTYEVPKDEWLLKPYVPRKARVLLHGESGSLKSLWAMWLSAWIAREGGKVAYFSSEMTKSATAKRLKQLDPPSGLKVYGRFMLGMNLGAAIECFEGYDLLVIDSWSTAQGEMSGNDNDAISRMDVDFFQPLIAATGATLLTIDNDAHSYITADGPVKRTTARGASRKRDIQEVELWMTRPDANNNFRTRLTMTKMRLDVAMPSPLTIETPQDQIEFFEVHNGMRTHEPMWPGLKVEPIDVREGAAEIAPGPSDEAGAPLTPLQEKLLLAKLREEFSGEEG